MINRINLLWAFSAVAVAATLSVRQGNAQPPADRLDTDAAPSQITAAESAEIDRRLATTFDRAVVEHAAATNALSWLKPGQSSVISTLAQGRPLPQHPPFHCWSLGWVPGQHRDAGGPVLYRSEAMERLVKRLAMPEEKDRVAAYVHLAPSYLHHQRPQYRAVACEFLAYFPLQMIHDGLMPAIAQRLGDSAAAFDGASFGLGQQATFITRRPNGVLVSDVARTALACATGFQFHDTAAFDAWWQTDKDYRHRIWYWTMRWAALPVIVPPAAAQSKISVAVPASKVSVETDFPALVHQLRPDEGLKMLLLANNPGAIAAQSGAKYTIYDPNPNVQLPPDAPVWSGAIQLYVEPRITAKFVKDHALKPHLLELLRQSQPWPEIAAKEAQNSLLSYVIEVLKLVAASPDAAAIEQALDHPIPALVSDPVLQTRLTLLLATLAPKRCEDILVRQFRSNPRQSGLAVELIRTTGLKHWDIIAPAVEDRSVRERILAPLGQLRTPQAAKILGGLLAGEQLAGDDLRNEITRWDHEVDGSRWLLFEQYVKAVTLFNENQPVIGQDLLLRSRSIGGKGSPSDKRTQHNQGVPAARAEAVEQLKAFLHRDAPNAGKQALPQ
jgi:hypothetical protein